jgi:hypothetical protein
VIRTFGLEYRFFRYAVDTDDCNGARTCELGPLFLAVADLDPAAMRATYAASADVRPVLSSLRACQRTAGTSYSPSSFEIARASRINLGRRAKRRVRCREGFF